MEDELGRRLVTKVDLTEDVLKLMKNNKTADRTLEDMDGQLMCLDNAD